MKRAASFVSVWIDKTGLKIQTGIFEANLHMRVFYKYKTH